MNVMNVRVLTSPCPRPPALSNDAQVPVPPDHIQIVPFNLIRPSELPAQRALRSSGEEIYSEGRSRANEVHTRRFLIFLGGVGLVPERVRAALRESVDLESGNEWGWKQGFHICHRAQACFLGQAQRSGTEPIECRRRALDRTRKCTLAVGSGVMIAGGERLRSGVSGTHLLLHAIHIVNHTPPSFSLPGLRHLDARRVFGVDFHFGFAYPVPGTRDLVLDGRSPTRSVMPPPRRPVTHSLLRLRSALVPTALPPAGSLRTRRRVSKVFGALPSLIDCLTDKLVREYDGKRDISFPAYERTQLTRDRPRINRPRILSGSRLQMARLVGSAAQFLSLNGSLPSSDRFNSDTEVLNKPVYWRTKSTYLVLLTLAVLTLASPSFVRPIQGSSSTLEATRGAVGAPRELGSSFKRVSTQRNEGQTLVLGRYMNERILTTSPIHRTILVDRLRLQPHPRRFVDSSTLNYNLWGLPWVVVQALDNLWPVRIELGGQDPQVDSHTPRAPATALRTPSLPPLVLGFPVPPHITPPALSHPFDVADRVASATIDPGVGHKPYKGGSAPSSKLYKAKKRECARVGDRGTCASFSPSPRPPSTNRIPPSILPPVAPFIPSVPHPLLPSPSPYAPPSNPIPIRRFHSPPALAFDAQRGGGSRSLSRSVGRPFGCESEEAPRLGLIRGVGGSVVMDGWVDLVHRSSDPLSVGSRIIALCDSRSPTDVPPPFHPPIPRRHPSLRLASFALDSYFHPCASRSILGLIDLPSSVSVVNVVVVADVGLIPVGSSSKVHGRDRKHEADVVVGGRSRSERRIWGFGRAKDGRTANEFPNWAASEGRRALFLKRLLEAAGNHLQAPTTRAREDILGFPNHPQRCPTQPYHRRQPLPTIPRPRAQRSLRLSQENVGRADIQGGEKHRGREELRRKAAITSGSSANDDNGREDDDEGGEGMGKRAWRGGREGQRGTRAGTGCRSMTGRMRDGEKDGEEDLGEESRLQDERLGVNREDEGVYGVGKMYNVGKTMTAFGRRLQEQCRRGRGDDIQQEFKIVKYSYLDDMICRRDDGTTGYLFELGETRLEETRLLSGFVAHFGSLGCRFGFLNESSTTRRPCTSALDSILSALFLPFSTGGPDHDIEMPNSSKRHARRLTPKPQLIRMGKATVQLSTLKGVVWGCSDGPDYSLPDKVHTQQLHEDDSRIVGALFDPNLNLNLRVNLDQAIRRRRDVDSPNLNPDPSSIQTSSSTQTSAGLDDHCPAFLH
ncbi:hypothetical protein FA13DRAFT_1712893 [Coprinellus micaceus]|uniref:Uncharacterized protein n=1 Tax=Coprinellus micaceus TaxID=71717 RepID=A0A4Y7SZ48_COPMI|nr:hypothetical protein FA13DRAFT_1712893 [Coprinellus micaceus]